MTAPEIRLTEECLYVCKYLHGRINILELLLEEKFPPSPGSVLKVVGRPVAKNPCDTSETEAWGIYRATCNEAQEIAAKRELKEAMVAIKKELGFLENKFIHYKYDREYSPAKVKQLLTVDHSKYFALRQRILRCSWKTIKDIYDIESALR